MKKMTFISLFFCLLALPALADQTTCEESRKSLLADDLLKKLTVKVCTHEPSSDPDVYMEYDKAYESTSASEFLVYEYTNDCYQNLNNELFKSKDQNQDTLKLADQLDAILCDFPESKEHVFRGAKLPEAVIENYLKADVISIPAFTSTSKAFHIACEFARKNGNTFMKIASKSGRAIEKSSKHEDELEVLFRMNTRFKVKNVISGFKASVMSGCKGVSHYFELEEIYDEEEIKPFVWPY
jgi:hypothetical protein